MTFNDLFTSREVFCGSKVALLHKDQILVYTRDDFAHIQHPDYIDLPGGAREDNETPFECLAREVMEEFGITIIAKQILWGNTYPNLLGTGISDAFFVGEITAETIKSIKFGDEGHSWRMMSLHEFNTNPRVIPAYVKRLGEYFQTRT